MVGLSRKYQCWVVWSQKRDDLIWWCCLFAQLASSIKFLLRHWILQSKLFRHQFCFAATILVLLLSAYIPPDHKQKKRKRRKRVFRLSVKERCGLYQQRWGHCVPTSDDRHLGYVNCDPLKNDQRSFGNWDRVIEPRCSMGWEYLLTSIFPGSCGHVFYQSW